MRSHDGKVWLRLRTQRFGLRTDTPIRDVIDRDAQCLGCAGVSKGVACRGARPLPSRRVLLTAHGLNRLHGQAAQTSVKCQFAEEEASCVLREADRSAVSWEASSVSVLGASFTSRMRHLSNPRPSIITEYVRRRSRNPSRRSSISSVTMKWPGSFSTSVTVGASQSPANVKPDIALNAGIARAAALHASRGAVSRWYIAIVVPESGQSE